MTDHNPISLLNLVHEELLDKWEEDWHHAKVKHIELVPYIAAMAAQWGADQELEACCEWVSWWRCLPGDASIPEIGLRAARRPTPSLKEQALEHLEQLHANAYSMGMGFDPSIIRRALEQLDD